MIAARTPEAAVITALRGANNGPHLRDPAFPPRQDRSGLSAPAATNAAPKETKCPLRWICLHDSRLLEYC